MSTLTKKYGLISSRLMNAISICEQYGVHMDIKYELEQRFPFYYDVFVRPDSEDYDLENSAESFVRFLLDLEEMVSKNSTDTAILQNIRKTNALFEGIVNPIKIAGFFTKQGKDGSEFSFEIPLLHAKISMQRCGSGFGMNITGIKNTDPHESILKTLQMAALDSKPTSTYNRTSSFIRFCTMCINEYFGIFSGSSNHIALYHWQKAFQKHLPLLDFSNDVNVMQNLMDEWVKDYQTPVLFCTFYGLPIYAQFSWGDEEQVSSSAWRKGALKCFHPSTGHAEFDDNPSSSNKHNPRLHLSIQLPCFDNFGRFEGSGNFCYDNHQKRMLDAVAYIANCLKQYADYGRTDYHIK